MKIGITIVFSVLLEGMFCLDNTTIGDIPTDIAAELVGLMTNKIISLIGGCQEKLKESDIELTLYTRNNPNNLPIILNTTNPIQINSNKKIIVLIHGWISNKFRFLPEVTDAYLKRYDSNLIIVDWSNIAKYFYTTSVCYVPKIAEVIGDLLCLLEGKRSMTIAATHLVGHSLGGHMSGFIGQYVLAKCGKRIGRITAMDPAGPFYQGLPSSQRLDKSDAMFVDVIHTNEGVLGYFGNCGHADFHVNCGTIQFGCPKIALSLESLKKLPITLVTCDHSRSVHYFLNSILNGDMYHATSCSLCPLFCIPNTLQGPYSIMGEDIPNNVTGGYVLAADLTPTWKDYF